MRKLMVIFIFSSLLISPFPAISDTGTASPEPTAISEPAPSTQSGEASDAVESEVGKAGSAAEVVKAALDEKPEKPEQPPTAAMPDDGQEFNFLVAAWKWIIARYRAHEYGPMAAGILMLLITALNWVLRRQGRKIKKKWMPTVVVITGIGGALSLQFMGIEVEATWQDWLMAVINGAWIGLAAVGAWEWLGKHLLSRFTKSDTEKTADEAKKAILKGETVVINSAVKGEVSGNDGVVKDNEIKACTCGEDEECSECVPDEAEPEKDDA